MVAVTGYSWSTALGHSIDEVWSRLGRGESGFSEQPCEHALRNKLVAALNGGYADMMPKEKMISLTCDNLRQAAHDAGLSVDDPRITIIIGTSLGSFFEDSLEMESLHEWIQEVQKRLGLKRDIIAISTACSSGSDSILLGLKLLQNGLSDICICGGSDVVTDIKRRAHTALGTLSPTILKSFDENRDGTLLGEGAGYIVMENLDSANQRKANPKAFCVGAGSSNDAAGMTSPDLSGLSIRLAVDRALAKNGEGLTLNDIDLINAHGSGTPINDALEIKAYNQIFENSSTGYPAIFATKGAFGHSLGATGALEAIALILALDREFVPPICHLSKVADDLRLKVPPAEGMKLKSEVGISITLGFGGFNTCLVFKKAS